MEVIEGVGRSGEAGREEAKRSGRAARANLNGKSKEMKFSELISIRQSVRSYQGKPVEKEKLQLLIESVRLAPSASNSQPWTLIIVNEPELKSKVARATFTSAISFNRFAMEAPVIAVLTVEKPKAITQVGGWIKQREFPLIDLGIAAEHFCLQAAELGMGTCMLGWFDEAKIKRLLKIPRRTRVGLLITLGYATEGYRLRPKIRMPTEAMSCFNSYRLLEE
jgi:nitroreductase